MCGAQRKTSTEDPVCRNVMLGSHDKIFLSVTTVTTSDETIAVA